MLRVLGPLEVAGEAGPVPLGAAKIRTLLAALTIERGTVASTDALIDALWGESPPRSAPKLLQIYVSRLRKVLPADIRVRTDPTGYMLEIADRDLDSATFERLVADGRGAIRAGNPSLGSSVLARALALWRGPAYADVRYEPFAREEAERLEALRSRTLTDRIDADLRLGRHSEVTAELRGLLASDPTDERLAALAMLAVYRSGGPAEATAIYGTTEAALREELDEEPGPELQDLRARMARRDPALVAEPVTDARRSLPAPPNALVGRERELLELAALIARPDVRLVSLTGAGGSGKSRLGLELARALEQSFANGAALVELASLRDPDLVLPTVARALGLDPGADAFATVAAALAEREQLLVLDNIEHLRANAPVLVRLLADAPRLVIVATTRVVLHVSGEHVYPVAPLPQDDAIALFIERAHSQDVAFAVDEAAMPLVAAICQRLDGLPLAIELAAARVRALGLRALDARLASRLTLLTGGPRDLPARQQTLRETLDWSADLLAPRERDVLAALAVFPGGCSMDAARVVAAADDDVLTTLVDHHLLHALDLSGERRFRLLETVREYAYELLGPRRDGVESQLLDWMGDIVKGADLMSTATPERLAMLDRELDTLRDAFRHAARDAAPTRELALAAGIWRYWWIRGHLLEGDTVLRDILARRGVVASRDGVRTTRAAASIAWSLGDLTRAADLASRALEVATQLADDVEVHAARNLLGVVETSREDLGAAALHLDAAIRHAEGMGREDLAVTAKTNLAIVYLSSGRLDEARDRLHEVLAFRRAEGNTEGVGFATINLGEVEFAALRLAEAESNFAEAAEAFRAIGFQTRVANALQGLAAVEARTGRADSAARRLGHAASLLGDTGWGADGTSLADPAIEAARAALGDETFERLFQEGAVDDAS